MFVWNLHTHQTWDYYCLSCMRGLRLLLDWLGPKWHVGMLNNHSTFHSLFSPNISDSSNIPKLTAWIEVKESWLWCKTPLLNSNSMKPDQCISVMSICFSLGLTREIKCFACWHTTQYCCGHDLWPLNH